MTVTLVTHDHHSEQNTKTVFFGASHKTPFREKQSTAAPLTCTPHNDTANYIDILVGGRIRTTCRVCKRFIGYRTVK